MPNPTERARPIGTRRFALTALLALSLSTVLLWLYATPLAIWASGQFLDSRSLALQRLEGLDFGRNGIAIAGLTLVGDHLFLDATGIQVELTPFRLRHIEVSTLRLEVSPQEEVSPQGTDAFDPAPAPTAASRVLGLQGLPVDQLTVERATIVAGGAEFNGRFHALRPDSVNPDSLDAIGRQTPVAADVIISLDLESPWPFSLQAESAGTDLAASFTGPNGLLGSFTGAVAGDSVTGAVEASFATDKLGEQLPSVTVLPGGTVTVNGPFTLTLTDSDFTFTSPELAVDIPGLSFTIPPAPAMQDTENPQNPQDTHRLDTHRLGARILLKQPVVRYWRAGAVEARRWYALSHFESQMLDLPWLAQTRIDGSLQLSGSGLRANATLTAGEQASLRGELLHAFGGGAGFLDLEIPDFQFSAESPLSALLSQDLPDFEIPAGSVAGAGSVEWSADGVGGGMLLRLSGLSGYYGDTAFLDFDTYLDIEMTPDLDLRSVTPLAASLSRLDPGLPLDRLRWDYEFDSGQGAVEIRQLQADFLGGQVTLPSLRLARGAALPNVNLVLADIDLAAATRLIDYDGLDVTGRVSGYLPLRIESGVVRIEDGLIGALRPGGTIRYTPAQEASDPRMRTVNEMLSDYRFDTLNSHVQLDQAGDLLLQAEITGTSSGFISGSDNTGNVNTAQPVNLNLNLSNNIPDLLRSLRAGRDISRILEQRLNAC